MIIACILPVVYLVLVVLNFKNKLSLSNFFVAFFCFLSIPVCLWLYVRACSDLLFLENIGTIIVFLTITPLTILISFIVVRINIFPIERNSKRLEKFPIEVRRIIGARRLVIYGLIGMIISLIPFIYYYDRVVEAIKITLMIALNPIILLLFFFSIFGIFIAFYYFSFFTFFIGPIISLYISYNTLLNGCIRLALFTGKSKKEKLLHILVFFIPGINIIFSFKFLYKSTKIIKNVKNNMASLNV